MGSIPIVMGGRLKASQRDVKDPDTIRELARTTGTPRDDDGKAAARPSDDEPGAVGHIVSGQKRVSLGQVYREERVQIYLVGGAVQDRLLGFAPGDQGITHGGRRHGGADAGLDSPRVGRDFPVFLHPKTQQEYALGAPSASRGRVTPASSAMPPRGDAGQDLLRRDLTISAIAEDGDGQLHDPCGGVQDLEGAVAAPCLGRPLPRIPCASCGWRAAAVPCPGFVVAPETLGLMRDDGGWRAGHLTPGSGSGRTGKVLLGPTPQIFFEVLRRWRTLKALFPSSMPCSVCAPARWHPEIDTGIHTMMVAGAGMSSPPN